MGVTRQTRLNPDSTDPIAEYTLIDPDGSETEHVVNFGSHYEFSWYDGGRPNDLFHVGGGNPNVTENAYEYDFGTYNLIPNNDFQAWAYIWGAGGGAYNSGNSSTKAGGGGFTQALVQFKAGTSYALTVGQAGRFNHQDQSTHGGGGGANNNSSGQGGGLSGIFMDSDHRGRSAWGHNPPFDQSQALVIAGGGGGAGHHNMNTHHGDGGAGGGWDGNRAHNSHGGTQRYGGRGNNYSSGEHRDGEVLHGGNGVGNSWGGGGGGGWYGGGGGAHGGTNHHNGGSGGSGHYAYPASVGSQPNNDKSQYILSAATERGVGRYRICYPWPGNYKSRLARRNSNANNGETQAYAGRGGNGNTNNTSETGSSALHGKIVLTLAPSNTFYEGFGKKQHSSPNKTIWGAYNGGN